MNLIKQKISESIIDIKNKSKYIKNYFDRIYDSEFNCIIISDIPGSGKTTLIMETTKELQQEGAYFVYGKYEQHGNNPYSALSKIIEEITICLLTFEDDKLQEVRTVLNKVLKSDVQIIISLCPMASKLFDVDKQGGNLDYIKLHRRLKKIISLFCELVGEFLYPLVVTIDDIQWADEGSIEIIESLLSNAESMNLFLILISRNNVPKYCMRVNELSLKYDIDKFEMGVFTKNQISMLIDTIFSQNFANKNKLVAFLSKNTFLNPFYIKQGLIALIDNNAIIYNSLENLWIYEENSNYIINDTRDFKKVIDNKIKNLEENLKVFITYCVCIGNDFQKNLLMELKEFDEGFIDKALDKIILEGFIVETEDGSYDFTHDIIFESVYNSITDDRREEIHLAIAKTIYKGDFNKENSINCAVHFLKAKDAIYDIHDKKLVLYLYEAGIKANKFAASQCALQIFSLCYDLLNMDFYSECEELKISVEIELSQSLFLCQELNNGMQRMKKILDKDISSEQMIVVKYRLLTMYTYTNEYEEVLNLGIQLLNDLNYKINIKNKKTEIVKLYGTNVYYKILHKLGIKTTITDENIDIVLLIMVRLIFVGYFVDYKILLIIIMSINKVCLKINQENYSIFVYSGHAFIHANMLNNKKKAKRYFVKINTVPNDIRPESINFMCDFITGSFVTHLFSPLHNCLDTLENAFEQSKRNCEYLISGYTSVMYRQTKYIMSENLKSISDTGFIEDKFEEKAIDKTLKWANYIFKHHLSFLMDRDSSVDVCGEEETIDKLDQGTKMTYYYYKIKRLYLIGEIEWAFEVCNKTMKLHNRLRAYLIHGDLIFFMLLTRIDIHNSLSFINKKKNGKLIEKYYKELVDLNKYSDNHKTRFLIADANYSYHIKNESGYSDKLIEATKLASDRKETYLEAMCYNFMAKHMNTKCSSYYANEAKSLYNKWGALRLAKYIKNKYKITEKQKHYSETQKKQELIDASIIYSYEEEVKQKELKNAFLYSINFIKSYFKSDFAGLYLEENGDLYEVCASYTGKNTAKNGKVELENTRDTAKKVLRYVFRTSSEVKLLSPPRHGVFQKDVFIRNKKELSLLCIPLEYNGIFTGVLYMYWDKNNQFNSNTTKEIKPLIQPIVTKIFLDRKTSEVTLKDSLSQREIEVLIEMSKGLTNKKIAEKLHISYRTVTTHVEHIYLKLSVSNRVEAVVMGVKSGII